jgi:hypothetical protein
MTADSDTLLLYAPLVIFLVGTLLAFVGVLRGFTKQPKPKHPDRKDVQLYWGKAFIVKIGIKSVSVGCDMGGSYWKLYSYWNLYITGVQSWDAPYESEPFTANDQEAVKAKLKNVLEAEGGKVVFK